MRTSIALSNIRHHPGRTLLSIGGIGIAILLIFMQLGFLNAVENTATTIYSKMDFDLLVRSPEYLYFAAPRQIPRSVLDEIASLECVEHAVPFHVGMAFWRHPSGASLRGMVLMGVDPNRSTFRDSGVSADFDRLISPQALLIDQKTHSEYGPRDGRRFGPADLGVTTDVNQQTVRVVGLFEMGSGLTANGAAIMSEEGFDRVDPLDSVRRVSLGLIQLKPGQDPTVAAGQIRQLIGGTEGRPYVDVLTRDQVVRRELRRWIAETPIGYVFTLGVIISVIVGSAIVYMVLATDVSNRIREYATFKAMGYSNWFLSRIVLQQAGYLAVSAFVPAALLAMVSYQVTAWMANIPIFMTTSRLAFVFGMSLAMCLVSAVLATRKLWKADPAELF